MPPSSYITPSWGGLRRRESRARDLGVRMPFGGVRRGAGCSVSGGQLGHRGDAIRRARVPLRGSRSTWRGACLFGVLLLLGEVAIARSRVGSLWARTRDGNGALRAEVALKQTLEGRADAEDERVVASVLLELAEGRFPKRAFAQVLAVRLALLLGGRVPQESEATLLRLDRILGEEESAFRGRVLAELAFQRGAFEVAARWLEAARATTGNPVTRLDLGLQRALLALETGEISAGTAGLLYDTPLPEGPLDQARVLELRAALAFVGGELEVARLVFSQAGKVLLALKSERSLEERWVNAFATTRLFITLEALEREMPVVEANSE